MQRCILHVGHGGQHLCIATKSAFRLPGDCLSVPVKRERETLPARKGVQRESAGAGIAAKRAQ